MHWETSSCTIHNPYIALHHNSLISTITIAWYRSKWRRLSGFSTLELSDLLIAAVFIDYYLLKSHYWFKKYRKSRSDIYYNIDIFAIFHWDFKPWHHSLHFWRYIYSWDHCMLFFMMVKIIYIVTNSNFLFHSSCSTIYSTNKNIPHVHIVY